MFDNHIYNLMKQMVQEHKALWRIKKHYKEDAGDCADCKAFWGDMERDKEAHIEKISELLKQHMA
jgi:hypothetical protein